MFGFSGVQRAWLGVALDGQPDVARGTQVPVCAVKALDGRKETPHSRRPMDAARDEPLAFSVVHRESLSETVLLVRLRRDAHDFVWMPGQHVKAASPLAPEVFHYYSIASAPDPSAPGEFELAVSRAASPEVLAELQPGGSLLVSRARGAFFWEPGEGATLLVGMGTGIAPLRAMLQAALARSTQPVRLLFGARTEADLLFRAEFEERARQEPHFRFEPTLTQPSSQWTGARGRVQDHLARVMQGLESVRAYLCGNIAMVGDAIACLNGLGVSESAIRAESHGT
jgi:CDP-4-dehydro-6-deoxyglucose reductase, E3